MSETTVPIPTPSTTGSLKASKTSLGLKMSAVLPLPKVLRHRSATIDVCSICLSSMLNPATLVCGHKLCEPCLKKHWQSGPLVCPLCHITTLDCLCMSTNRRERMGASCTTTTDDLTITQYDKSLCTFKNILKVFLAASTFYYVVILLKLYNVLCPAN